MTNILRDKTTQEKVSDDIEKGNKTLPDTINLEKWEDSGYVWSGEVIPNAFKRLVSMIPDGYQDKPIELKCELTTEGQLLTLIMDFSGEIWVTCQRCLQPLAIDITHQSKLILLQFEAQECLVGESDDYVMLDELLATQAESLKDERLLPLSRLVEDELLLDVPLSAKHDDCEMAVQQVGEIIEEETENPFAVLESLKGKL